MKVQDDGRPRLFIVKTCVNTINEIIGYRWAEGTETRDPTDQPLKISDHCPDCIRYGIYGVEGNSYFSESDLK